MAPSTYRAHSLPLDPGKKRSRSKRPRREYEWISSPDRARFHLHRASCISCSFEFYRFQSFQGWTSDSTIERLHRRSVNPLPVTDVNKFLDDQPGKSVEIGRATTRWISGFSARFRSPRCRHGYATGEELFEKSLQRGGSSVRIDRGRGIGAAFNQQALLLAIEGCSSHCHRRHSTWIHNRLVRIIVKFFKLFSTITFCINSFACDDFWFSFFGAESIIRVRYLLGWNIFKLEILLLCLTEN